MKVKRNPGRPKKDESVLDAQKILTAASQVLLQDKSSLSLRAVARQLEVDPMAIYRYFPSKEVLQSEVAMWLFQDLALPEADESWKDAVLNLALSYSSLLEKYPGLLPTLIRLGAAARGPAHIFRQRFTQAMDRSGLMSDQVTITLELIVDYIHGYMFAYQQAKPGELRVAGMSHNLKFFLECVSAFSE